jgi:hypothetical protein
MHHFLIILIYVGLTVLPISILAQPEPTLTDPSEPNSEPIFNKELVWHKNMELICPVPFRGSQITAIS